MTLKCDNAFITVYEATETAVTRTQYDGLGIHKLVQSCLALHRHENYPDTSRPHRRDHKHVIVDWGAYEEMVKALVALTGKYPQSQPGKRAK